MLIQEPYTTTFNTIWMPANFRLIFPVNRLQNEELTGQYGKISIFNIYNDCNHSRNKRALQNYIHNNSNSILGHDNKYMI